jgi:hypothetical protein
MPGSGEVIRAPGGQEDLPWVSPVFLPGCVNGACPAMDRTVFIASGTINYGGAKHYCPPAVAFMYKISGRLEHR